MNRKCVRLLITVILFGFVTGANAEKGPDDWKYAFGVYFWANGIEGTTQVGPVTAPVSITFSDALENLSSALMLHFEAQKNQWGVMVDVLHVGLAPSASLPGGASLNIDLTNNVVDVGGIYQPASTEKFQLLFGLRFSSLEIEGTVPGVASRSIVDESWTDGFIGGRILAPFAEHWRFRARGDIGAGDSDFVWSALLALDYQFNNRVTGLLGYRWLDYDYDNGEAGPNRFVYDATYEGPLAAVVFTW